MQRSSYDLAIKEQIMLTITSFGIGDTYVQELHGFAASVRKNSPNVEMILGVGKHGSNKIHFCNVDNTAILDKRFVEIPIPAELVSNWNNIGFIKAYWIYVALTMVRKGQLVMWIDADARVKGDLNQIYQDFDGDIGMVKYQGNHWLNGTMVVRNTEMNLDWVTRWWGRCLTCLRPHHDDWKLNDQTVLRSMIENHYLPPIIDLGEKWASLPPQLRGQKHRPIPVRPTMEDAIIHHWQASRGVVKGWNWPPHESER